MGMIIQEPFILPRTKKVLHLSHSDQIHPLAKDLVIIAFLVCGNCSDVKVFLEGQPKYSCLRGDPEPKNNIRRIYQDGFGIVTGAKLIQFRFLSRK